ncbi:hypothetical protein [Peribacillus frigoritolerans]|uniref:hypothetical protein n=1 Tax=Peribacillus frigoritolerans TaxID=450367 RepID=UPI00207AF9FF|nr:hypothetical protein [Peribacillus frigoritolerans]USK77844.1 hypothetical protein LIT31_26990 [Peribacillus frigoritolerans]
MNERIHLPIRVATETISEDTLGLINRHALEPVKMEDIFTFSGTVQMTVWTPISQRWTL